MSKEYFLVLRIITPAGEEILGKFFLGNSTHRAYGLFEQLQGDRAGQPSHFIFFDLVEVENGLPTNLKLLGCNLEQAGFNVKIIIRDSFKYALDINE